MGGRDMETEKDYKKNAPSSYLKSYTTSTIDTYMDEIKKRSPISILHVDVWQGPVVRAESYGSDGVSSTFRSSIRNSVIQEITRFKRSLIVTAIRANGEKFDDPKAELLDPLVLALHDKKSPNDSLAYIEPTFINLRVNAIVETKSSVSQEEIREDVHESVMEKYSVFNTNFKKPLYRSEIEAGIKTLPYADNTSMFIEARGDVLKIPMILSNKTGVTAIMDDEDAKLAFEFSFNKTYAKNIATSGFANFMQSSDYLIRADVRFTEHPEDDKTFFLLDNRTNKAEIVELMEAEWLQIDGDQTVPSRSKISYEGFGDYYHYNEFDDNFFNRQVRTAQFSFVDKITDDQFMKRLFDHSVEPFEDRPLYVDDNGRKKLFKREDIEDSEQVSITLVGDAQGVNCYRKNIKYYEDSKIVFFENYDQPDSSRYARGFLVVPMHRIIDEEERSDIKRAVNTMIELPLEIQKALMGRVKINVFARPLSEDVYTIHRNDIVFVREDDVVVEKRYPSV
jgi:hypothetical protein